MNLHRVLLFCVFSAGTTPVAAGPLCLLYEGSEVALERAQASHFACKETKRRSDPFKDLTGANACQHVGIGYKGCEATAQAYCQAWSRRDTAMASCNEEKKLERESEAAERRREREAEQAERQHERDALDLAEEATDALNSRRDTTNPANALSQELTDTALGVAAGNGRTLLDMVDDTFGQLDDPGRIRSGSTRSGTTSPNRITNTDSLLEKVDAALKQEGLGSDDLLDKVDRGRSGGLGGVNFEGVDVMTYDLFPDTPVDSAEARAEQTASTSDAEDRRRRMQEMLSRSGPQDRMRAMLSDLEDQAAELRRQAQQQQAHAERQQQAQQRQANAERQQRLNPRQQTAFEKDCFRSAGNGDLYNKCRTAAFLFTITGSTYHVLGWAIQPINGQHCGGSVSKHNCSRSRSEYKGRLSGSCAIRARTFNGGGWQLSYSGLRRPEFPQDPCWKVAQCVKNTGKGPGTCW